MITIEEARPEHVEAIVSLWEDLMEIHKKIDAEFFDATDTCVEEYASGIRGTISSSLDDRKVFVALTNETVVGYVTVEIMHFSMLYYNFDSLCVIGDIMIAQPFRKQGIGELFIEEAKKMAKEFSVMKLMLNVFAKNQIAYQYFKQHGFEDTMCRMTKMVD